MDSTVTLKKRTFYIDIKLFQQHLSAKKSTSKKQKHYGGC